MRTKREFERFFRAEIMPDIRSMEKQYTANSGQVNKKVFVDVPLRRESWNNLIDAMVQDGSLPICAMDWECPW